MKCNHAVTKLLPSLWLACTWVGIFPGYNTDGDRDPAEDLATRNCSVCHSSLCIPMAQERRWLAEQEQPKRVLDLMEGM